MRLLSVRQPWASLIASGKKTIELRSWTTRYRGPVVILSGAAPWKGDHCFAIGPLGVAMCVVDIVDVRRATSGDTRAACIEPPADFFAWELRNPRPTKQIVVRGKLGLYTDSNVIAAICAG